MRSITLSIVIGVVLVFSLSAAGLARAQPNGSYLQTCRNVAVAGKYRPDALLTAQCQTKKAPGGRAACTTRAAARHLQRQRYAALPGRAGRQPRKPTPGSWRASCRNAFVDGGTLHAECQAVSGRWIDARLNMGGCPWGPVANDNGRLVCGGGPGGGNFTTLILFENFNFSGPHASAHRGGA